MKRLLAGVVVLLAAAGMTFASGSSEKSSGPAMAAKPKVVIATDATWPPMEFVDANKQIVGFDIDMMTAAAKAAGFDVEFKNTAWDGIFAGLANGDYDAVCSSVTITDERKKTMDFSIPYINAGQVLVIRKDESGIKTLADLSGKQVGAQIGTTGAMAIQKVPSVQLKTYDEIGLAVEDLDNGRIDGVVVDSPTAANYVLQNDKYKGRLEIVGKPFTDEFYGVAVQKGNTKVLDLINKGLAAVQKDGTIEKLQAKWLR